MKLYCFLTQAYQDVANEWFLPSLKDNYEVVLGRGNYMGNVIQYKEPGWNDITRDKVKFIIKAIKDNWGEDFVFSDPDIQFFSKTRDSLLRCLKNNDIVFQRDSPQGIICTGFFICRANRRTSNFWEKVLSLAGKRDRDDQDAVNYLINCNLRIRRYFPLFARIVTKSSQLGINSFGVRWSYLPVSFLSGGTLSGKMWKPGTELAIPKDIILHHANWTLGLENKIMQLKMVRDAVNLNKSSFL